MTFISVPLHFPCLHSCVQQISKHFLFFFFESDIFVPKLWVQVFSVPKGIRRFFFVFFTLPFFGFVFVLILLKFFFYCRHCFHAGSFNSKTQAVTQACYTFWPDFSKKLIKLFMTSNTFSGFNIKHIYTQKKFFEA